MAITIVDFSESGIDKLHRGRYANWPVVYILYDGEDKSARKTLYIGETCNIFVRLKQHQLDERRAIMKHAAIISEDSFNKSVTLDMEQELIRLCDADGNKLQNMNAGQSASHNYYDRKRYKEMVPGIWEELRRRKITHSDYHYIVNSDIFKFSPYTSLTDEQAEVREDIILDILKSKEEGSDRSFVVRGGAGTGKTIMALSILKTLLSLNNYSVEMVIDEFSSTEEISHINKLARLLSNFGEKLDVALVVPMVSLRETLRAVAKATDIGADKIIGPSDVVKHGEKYDILLVDESHRLAQYRNIVNRKSFKDCCKKLGMDYTVATQLDWIKACSHYQILFYDSEQSVKKSDIDEDRFSLAVGNSIERVLTSQMRCSGGELFIDYISSIMDCKQISRLQFDGNYDFRLYDSVSEMVEAIRTKDRELGLGRIVSGYSWKWVTKKKTPEEIKTKGLFDIEIEGNHYVWNMTDKGWILSKGSVDQIGCIHTTQGYDLNYVGVIFGREIDYEPKSNSIVIDKDLFFDTNVKNGTTPEELKRFIINAYRTLMSRGIHGCYVYAYNENLRNYLRRYIDNY